MIDFTNKAITTKSDLESEQLLKKAVAQGFGLPKGEKALITNRFFSGKISEGERICIRDIKVFTTYSDLRIEEKYTVKDLLGKNDYELYKKYFGEVEEA